MYNININYRCIICNSLVKDINDIDIKDDVCYRCIGIQRKCEAHKSITVDLDKGGK